MHFCFVFAMDILSLHWGNISVDICIGDNLTDVYLKGCIVIREKQAWKTQYVGWGGWVGYRTHQSALVTFPLQEDFSEQRGILCARHIRFISNQGKGCSSGQTCPCTVSTTGATQDCAHPSHSVPWRGKQENVYPRDARLCDDVINRIQLTAVDITPGQLFFVRGLI
jgi:hypothetical protein